MIVGLGKPQRRRVCSSLLTPGQCISDLKEQKKRKSAVLRLLMFVEVTGPVVPSRPVQAAAGRQAGTGPRVERGPRVGPSGRGGGCQPLAGNLIIRGKGEAANQGSSPGPPPESHTRTPRAFAAACPRGTLAPRPSLYISRFPRIKLLLRPPRHNL